ncbi:hypothetical protein Tco_1492789 [Tanacetum coccineum]
MFTKPPTSLLEAAVEGNVTLAMEFLREDPTKLFDMNSKQLYPVNLAIIHATCGSELEAFQYLFKKSYSFRVGADAEHPLSGPQGSLLVIDMLKNGIFDFTNLIVRDCPNLCLPDLGLPRFQNPLVVAVKAYATVPQRHMNIDFRVAFDSKDLKALALVDYICMVSRKSNLELMDKA